MTDQFPYGIRSTLFYDMHEFDDLPRAPPNLDMQLRDIAKQSLQEDIYISRTGEPLRLERSRGKRGGRSTQNP